MFYIYIYIFFAPICFVFGRKRQYSETGVYVFLA